MMGGDVSGRVNAREVDIPKSWDPKEAIKTSDGDLSLHFVVIS